MWNTLKKLFTGAGQEPPSTELELSGLGTARYAGDER